jgi:hypothetical protein
VVDTNGNHRPVKPESRPGPGPNPTDRHVLEKALHDLAGFGDDLMPYMHKVQAKYAADLVGPNPSGVEDALAQTAAINWYTMRLFEALFFKANNARGQTLREAEAMQRMINHAHKRLLSTLRTLAVIRRLDAVAQVQINIAGQQVVGDAHCGPGRENRPGNGR